jgi:H+/Cl- antiporter ClcA
LIGLVVGVAVTGYSYALEGLIKLLWVLLPRALSDSGLFANFPLYNLNWIIPLVWGGLCAGILLMLLKRFGYGTGSIILAIRGVHDDGTIPFANFVPMLFGEKEGEQKKHDLMFLLLAVSLITITAGGSAGPEASVIVMGGALMQALNRLLQQPLRERRIVSFFLFCFVFFLLMISSSWPCVE